MVLSWKFTRKSLDLLFKHYYVKMQFLTRKIFTRPIWNLKRILRYWNISNTEFISSSKNFTSYIFSNKGLSFVAKWRMRFNLNILSWINENQFRYSKYRKYNLITKLASNTGAEIKNLKFKWVTLCVYSQLIKSLWY